MSTILGGMDAGDYKAVMALWTESEGIGLSTSDSLESIEKFLQRNQGLSFVATVEMDIVGAVLCGHDGRRGYLHHLAVARSHRRRGIGRRLVTQSLNALGKRGIEKCHLVVFESNPAARDFWHNIGWTLRKELVMMSAWIQPDATVPEFSD
jgi:ribosomal protein S18 acetylase RimI-like enzyme